MAMAAQSAINSSWFVLLIPARRASTAPRRTCGRLWGFLPFHELWGFRRSRRLQVGRGAAAESRDLALVPYTGGTRSPHACFPSLTSNYACHASNSLICFSTTANAVAHSNAGQDTRAIQTWCTTPNSHRPVQKLRALTGNPRPSQQLMGQLLICCCLKAKKFNDFSRVRVGVCVSGRGEPLSGRRARCRCGVPDLALVPYTGAPGRHMPAFRH